MEDVVELGAGEVDGDVLVVGDFAQVFKVADAVFVEDDLADGEALRWGWGGLGMRLRCCGARLVFWEARWVGRPCWWWSK